MDETVINGMHITESVEVLIRSYSKQCDWYKELIVIVQKILGKVALSRGAMDGVMELFSSKQELLGRIASEREAMQPYATVWQQQKKYLKNNQAIERLDSLLGETQQMIRQFLDIEDQLRLYLERRIDSAEHKVRV